MDKPTHEIKEELEHHPSSENNEEVYHLKGTPYHHIYSPKLGSKKRSSQRQWDASSGINFVILSELEAFIISSSFVDTAIGVVFATFFGVMMQSFIGDITGK